MSIYIHGMDMPTKENAVILITPNGDVWMIGDMPNEDTHLAKAKAVPAADVREVVLCRDCKCYQQSNFIDKHMECGRNRFPTHSVDFCSFGVKREKS